MQEDARRVQYRQDNALAAETARHAKLDLGHDGCAAL